MPIPRELFDRELDPFDKKIIDALDADPRQAFTLEELAAKVGSHVAFLTLLDRMIFSSRLYDLAERSLILKRGIRGQEYYASAKQPQA